MGKLLQTMAVSLAVFLLSLTPVLGQEPVPEGEKIVQTVYHDTYTLGSGEDAVIERQITLTNLTARLYVSEYAFTFRSPDRMNALAVFEDGRELTFQKTMENDRLTVKVKFANPAVGRGTVKRITIRYGLDGLVTVSGAHRELLIPVNRPSSTEELTAYTIDVRVPADFPELGISKPLAREAGPGLYRFTDVREHMGKTLYISFARMAHYRLTLNYSLANNVPYPRRFTIPFVPDGVFQKVYVDDISPKPERVYLDEDGNYMGVYRIPANTVQKVVFQGIVELTTEPREEVRSYVREKLSSTERNRYLTMEKYWQLSDASLAKVESAGLTNAFDIYNYVIAKLEYDTGRINSGLKRMGAEWALNNPGQAVCMEYTDLFIGIAREKGIPAREVVGYALTRDPELTPLSFLGDVLHAWPEYYDTARESWRPVDPTWGDTAGLDYYANMDLSHIAFVYHGKDPTYPLPAGVYKIKENTKDVFVEGTEEVPEDKRGVAGLMTKELNWVAGRRNTFGFVLDSMSNIFLYNVRVELVDPESSTVLASRTVDVLEPYGEKEVKFVVDSPKVAMQKKGRLQIRVDGNTLLEKEYTLRAAYLHIYDAYKGVFLGVAVGLLVLVYVKLRS